MKARVCVCERERESVCVCVCERERERERERDLRGAGREGRGILPPESVGRQLRGG